MMVAGIGAKEVNVDIGSINLPSIDEIRETIDRVEIDSKPLSDYIP